MRIPPLALAFCLFAAPAAAADRVAPAVPLGAAGRLPVREVTVFKDGHAFVVRSGAMPLDAAGNVVLDDLPSPVLGTFWPWAEAPGATLKGVVAGRRRVLVPRTALQMEEILRANPGAEVLVREPGRERYAATLVGVPARSTEELARTTLPGDPVPLPVHSALVILKTPEGTRAVPAARIEEILFRDGMKTEVAVEEERDLLTLRLDWKGAKPPATAEVGMGYLQKGLRWIPSYRIEILGGGKVSVRLQGTLINELADLEGVTAHLVVGVPSFDFAGSPDPVGLQGTLARLSPFFQNAQGGALTNAAIASNYVVTQQAMRMGESRGGEGGGGGDEEGSGADGEKSEDLFLFTLRGVTLRRGERMVVPVSETVLPYEDAWALDLPFTPPAEMRQGNQDPRLAALLRMMARPKVMHRLCIRNTGTAPLTTAPALLLKEGRVLGQGTMTYAAPGSTVDLDVTAAVDIRVTKSERETGRTPAAMNWNGRKYGRIDLAGTVTLENRFDRPVTVAVTRWVLGAVDSVEGGGSAEAVSLRAAAEWRGGPRGSRHPPGGSRGPRAAGGRRAGGARGGEDDEWRGGPGGSGLPPWWSWWHWPSWWSHLNGAGKITWSVAIEPGEKKSLGYAWHYFWD